jgi:3-phosphoshikimate 1-carboxyvinyltransferase
MRYDEVRAVSKVADYAEVPVAERPIDAVVALPGSKSYTNRALLIAALANGQSRLERALFSDDTRYMVSALRNLGIRIGVDARESSLVVDGASGRVPVSRADLFIGNAGTAARFLTAYVALGSGEYRIDGISRMRERPIGPLLSALRQLGVSAQSEQGNDCPPVVVKSRGLRGGAVEIAGDLSSQFLSALLMIAPCTPGGLEIQVQGELVSKPYVDLTLSVMRGFGVSGENHAYRQLVVPGGQSYRAQVYPVEPDASGASYFLAAAAVTGGRVRISALGRDSVQGDLRLASILERMGCQVTWGDDFVEVSGPATLRGIDVDMADLSDVAQTLAAIAPFASAPVRIRGVAHIRRKETDRIAAMTSELRRLGATVVEHDDGWEIAPSELRGVAVNTYDDHRMAMSLAVTALRVPGVRILDPGCVAKTFPDFFERFAKLTAS